VRKPTWQRKLSTSELKLVEVAKQEAEEYLRRYGIAPTVRQLFYILVSKNVIPNTRSSYQKLSNVLARARYFGCMDWKLIRDESRYHTNLEPQEYYRIEPFSENEIEDWIKWKFIDSFNNIQVNPWLDQKYRVVLVIEKYALYDAINHFVKQEFEFGVRDSVPIRGYDSATDVYNMANLAFEIIKNNQIPVFLQLGDFDPSGEDIKRDFQVRVKHVLFTHFKCNVEPIFEIVAVTKEQIERYNLPHRPEDEAEIRKLMRDPRFKRWQYGLYRVELDAMLALIPEEFKRIVGEAIRKYFDFKIYEEVTKKRIEEIKAKVEEAKRKTIENLRRVIQNLKI